MTVDQLAPAAEIRTALRYCAALASGDPDTARALLREHPDSGSARFRTTVGGHLTDPTGAPRSLVELRRMLDDWADEALDDDADHVALRVAAGLAVPEESRSTTDAASVDGIVAALACTLRVRPAAGVADRRYRYWPTRCSGVPGTGPDTVHPLWIRAYELVHDPRARDGFLDGLHRYRARLDNSGRRMDALDHGALIEYFVEAARRPQSRAELTRLVHRAMRAAVYHRAGEYFDRWWPSWRTRLAEFDVRLAEATPPSLGTAMPTVAVWLRLHDEWVEPAAAGPAPPTGFFAARSSWTDHLPDDPGLEAAEAHRLGAVLELAFDDVAQDPARRLTAVDEELAELLPGALVQLLACDRLAAQLIIDAQRHAPPWRGDAPPETLLLTGLVGRDAVRVRDRPTAPAGPTQPAGPPREPGKRSGPDQGVLLDRLRTDLASARGRSDPPLWATDVDYLHEVAVALQAMPKEGRTELVRPLTELVLHTARQEGRHPEEVRGLMDSLNILSLLLATAGRDDLQALLTPTLLHLRPVEPGPYVAMLLRAVTIVHSKHHRYRDAEHWLNLAWATVRPMLDTGADEPGFIKVREAAHQVALQAAGMYMRLLEFRLADPAHHRRTGDRREAIWRELRQLSEMGLRSSAFAYAELDAIDRHFGLPERRSRQRSSSRAWSTNTRCMHMRALLLRATVEAVDAGRSGSRLSRAEAEQGLVGPLVDAVPAVYRETLRLPLDADFVNEVTRVAMHYAFLTGMRFLPPPPGAADRLPAHLTRAVQGPGPGADRRFDLSGASRHLLSAGHDAGILACVTQPEVRAVLDERSRPAGERLMAGSRAAGPAGASMSPYLTWLTGQEQIAKLRRRLRLDLMPQEVGAFAAGRRLMRRDWSRWHWQV